MKSSLRIAHISDPHFAKIVFHPSQFLSKRWIGNLNLILLRSQFYHLTPLFHLPELLASLNVDRIFITGDFASTSLNEEFEEAQRFVKQFKAPVHALPGNHDCYTKEAENEHLFYRYFPDEALERQKVACQRLSEKWWWIGLDCTLATPPLNAYGIFTPLMEERLESTIDAIPRDHSVIVGNHFPLFGSNRPKHDLKAGERLQGLLKRFSNVKLYLHGHDHRPYMIDRRKEGYPLVCNTGSCASKRHGGISIFDLGEGEFLYKRYTLDKTSCDVSWILTEEKTFT